MSNGGQHQHGPGGQHQPPFSIENAPAFIALAARVAALEAKVGITPPAPVTTNTATPTGP